ncbi:carbon-nitrogen hydrolase family protein [Aeromicrobium sp. UC242_57]|uniref:carbon-nitrogen hydrolase family protein n=1 Tax=Aeromicrobium sp. UC242_57 TaxID=3374624 RepID=UPI0037BB141D
MIGFLELDGDLLRNTAVLLGPGGVMATYRKTHLPHLGADRFVTPGDNEPVLVETPLGVVGLSICYDLRFPEWARCLALGGADIIANPTNWPAPAERVAELFTRGAGRREPRLRDCGEPGRRGTRRSVHRAQPGHRSDR